MDSVSVIFRRLVFFAVGILLGGLSAFASAAAPVDSWANVDAVMSQCAANTGIYTPHTCFYAVYPNLTPEARQVRWTRADCPAGQSCGWNVYNSTWFNAEKKCADGSAPDTSKPLDQQCPATCKLPYVLDTQTQTCKDPCELKKGRNFETSISATKFAPNVCSGSCEATIVQASNQYKLKGAGGAQVIAGTWSYTGKVGMCDANKEGQNGVPVEPQVVEDVPGKDTPSSCAKAGKSWIEMNGSTSCISPSSSNPLTKTNTSASTSSQQTTNSDGSTSSSSSNQTKTVDVINDGSGVDKVETTTTTTNADGTSSTSTSSENKDDYCSKHSSEKVCKGGAYSTSGCASMPTCDGDAVMCGVAMETWQLKCAMTKDGAQSELGTKLVDGLDPLAASLPKVATAQTVNVSQTLQTASNSGRSLGSGVCPADKVISAGSRSFTLPLGQLCPYYLLIGNVVVAAAAFAAMFIVGKG